MKKSLFIAIIIVVLLAIPASMMLASGDLFPEDVPPYKVAVVSDYTNTGTIYVYNGVAGVEKATRTANVPIEANLYMAENKTSADYAIAIQKAISDGAELVVAPGYDAVEATLAMARENPDVQFLTVDATIDEYPQNVANIIFRSNEPSFVAGYIAGMTTQTGTLGFLGGVKIDSVEIFYYGFKAGIDIAMLEQDRQIKLLDHYADSFIDEELGYQLSLDMYSKGADNIFTVAGNTGLGGIDAAQELNKYAIGVDVDQNYLAPRNVMCSVVKELAPIISAIVSDYAYGVSYGGGPIDTGYTEGTLKVASIIDDVPDNIRDEAEKLEELLTQGVLTIPANAEEYKSWAPARAVAIITAYLEAQGLQGGGPNQFTTIRQNL